MAVEMVTVSHAGDGPGAEVELIFKPKTTNGVLTGPDFYRVEPYKVTVPATGGGFTIDLPTGTDQDPFLWDVEEKPVDRIEGRGIRAYTLGPFSITEPTTYEDLIATSIDATAVDSLVLANFSALAAQVATDRAAVEAIGTTTDAVIAGKVADPASATATALSASFAAAAGRLMRPDDGAKWSGRIRAGLGGKIAVVGDSLAAGYDGSGSAYGESKGAATMSVGLVVALSSIREDPNFVEPDPAVATVGTTTFPGLPYHNVSKSSGVSLAYPVKQITPMTDGATYSDKVTCYFCERTSDAAVTFDAVTTSGTTTVDSYVAPLTYSGSVSVGPRLATKTVTGPTTESATLTLNNLQTLDRGSGAAADGSYWFLGATRGPGIKFANYAVASTTLLNTSAANTSRGVTTDERFTKLIAYAPDLAIIGFGTNDSKPGVSTVAAFKADLIARIAQVRAALPDTIIVLITAPAGKGGDYTGNPAYNQAIRDVALSEQVSCFDVEAFMANQPSLYADDVHSTNAGYAAQGNALSQMLGLRRPFAPAKVASTDSRLAIISGAPSGTPTTAGKLTSRVGTDGRATLYLDRTQPSAGTHLVAGAHRSLSHTLTTGGRTIDRDIQDVQILTLSHVAAGTISVTNGFEGDELIVVVKQDATGGGTITTWNGFKFAGGVNPTLTSTASAVDIFRFWNDGTSWREIARSMNQAA